MTRWIALVMVALLSLVVAPRTAAAQQPGPQEASDLLLRAGGSLRIGPGEQAGSVMVFGGDAIIEGKVTRSLLVVGGTAIVTGRVTGYTTVIGGRLDLGQEARTGDVSLIDSELITVPGSVIAGQVHRTSGAALGWGVSWVAWVSMTVLVVVAGLLFAALGGRQLAGAAAEFLARPSGSILTALLLWVGLPVVAVVAFFTVVGIPLGFLVLFVVVPALWFLGYIVAGTGLGALLRQAGRSIGAGDHPYKAVVLGLLLLQLLMFVPWVGGPLAMLAGMWGAGALALRSWHVLRRRPVGFAPA
uniref:Polymer-forming cytoskeletal protein n=1 Tax=Jahnella sp. MSr9139 TaxID=1434086 RepID=A0A3Q8I2B3_9BACT|nr:hypothetical protein [Jahnella sp. MSr9139]